jgi:hypothetical protein
MSSPRDGAAEGERSERNNLLSSPRDGAAVGERAQRANETLGTYNTQLGTFSPRAFCEAKRRRRHETLGTHYPNAHHQPLITNKQPLKNCCKTDHSLLFGKVAQKHPIYQPFYKILTSSLDVVKVWFTNN